MSVKVDKRWVGMSRGDLYVALKNRPCMDCGGSFPTECMDFDHRPGVDKKFGISQKFFMENFDEVLEEIEKCDLVCSNCHRIRTAKRGQTSNVRYGETLVHWSHYEMTPGEKADLIRFHSRVSQVGVVNPTTSPRKHSGDKTDALPTH